jgi:hypothetical protein
MADDEIDGVKVTKCPPGKAKGADDLRLWGQRRMVGRSGVVEFKHRLLMCACGATFHVRVRSGADIGLNRKCRRCGKVGKMKIIPKKKGKPR